MLRRPATVEDAPEIHRLTRQWESFWGAPLVTPLQEIIEEFGAPFLDPDRHTLTVWDGADLVAYGRIWFRPSGENQERAYLQGFVDPEHRGRGIGRELMAWQVDSGTAVLKGVGNGLPKYLRADEWDWIDESHRMYRRYGLAPVRYFTEMLKPLEGATTMEAPDGIRIVPYDRNLNESALNAMNRSFADHWGSTPSDLASFEHRLETSGMILDASFLALAGEEVVGLALNAHYPEDEELLGRRDGWIETLGVVREFRKRGIATALLLASFDAFSERGYTHAALGVDTASPTDAHDLYSGLGFSPTHRSITSEVEVTD